MSFHDFTSLLGNRHLRQQNQHLGSQNRRLSSHKKIKPALTGPNRHLTEALVELCHKEILNHGACILKKGSSEVITNAIRDTDNLIRCLVPGDLAKGTYEVQVSNFGDDWSSSRLIEGYNSS